MFENGVSGREGKDGNGQLTFAWLSMSRGRVGIGRKESRREKGLAKW